MLRVLRQAVGLLLLTGAIAYTVSLAMVLVVSQQDQRQPVDAIVVLGAAQYDGVPSPVLANRLDHVVELYEDGIAPLIVVTGGRQPGDRFTEAGAGATYLQQHGVPGSAIERETTGGTTWESLAAAARFLRDDGITDVVLVSDGYHNLRIGGIAHELGLEAEVSPASGRAPLGALMRETVAVAVGRLIGYDRLVRLDETVEQAGVLAPGAAR